ncbi:unnamed protein product [Ambrosiozyma monospora]|uniref:Unnamed protein product n=1 Tax=Ambrosiozyma monospora TaxID=43982 RepID=A0A9W6YVK8_AMBMO|nr:unnamed protein product [Ambrosiozyma monospora]
MCGDMNGILETPGEPPIPTLTATCNIRNDSLTSTNHKKFKILSNSPTPVSRTTIIKGIETFYEQQKSRFNNIPITCGFDNYNPKMVYINPAQIYDLSDEVSEDDYNDSITSLFVCISMHRFEDEEQVTYTLASMDSESTNKVVTLSFKIPNGLYVSLPRIKEILLPSDDFYIYSTLMGKSGDIQVLDTTECFNIQMMANVKTQTAKIPNETPFKTNKDRKNKHTQLTPEENETMIIANAINTLNQVTEATENKVFKHILQNQLRAISESLVTHVKYQVENDPLKNPAPCGSKKFMINIKNNKNNNKNHNHKISLRSLNSLNKNLLLQLHYR